MGVACKSLHHPYLRAFLRCWGPSLELENIGKVLESGSGEPFSQETIEGSLKCSSCECGFSDLCPIPWIAEAWGRRGIFSVHVCLHLPLLNIYGLVMALGKTYV